METSTVRQSTMRGLRPRRDSLRFFDACDGSVYYNTFDNYVWGDIRSIGGYDHGYYLRHTFQNWHLQIQCYNPLTKKYDWVSP